MYRHLLHALCLVVMLAIAAPSALAQPFPDIGFVLAQQSRPSFRIIGAGARAAGMGGAFTALADDASAASFNPAGLALLIEPELSLVGEAHRRSEDYTDFVNLFCEDTGCRPVGTYSDSEISFDSRSLNFAALTLPFAIDGRNLGLQVSYHRQIDFTIDAVREISETGLAGQPRGSFNQVITQDGDVHTISLGAGYQLTPRMSVGVNVANWSGGWTFESRDEAENLATEGRAAFTYRQRATLRGWRWNLGVLLRYPRVNVGFNYRLPFQADATFEDSLTSDFTEPVAQPRATIPLEWPDSWTLGLAFKPTDLWVVTVDYARYNWSEMELVGAGDDGRSINFFDLAPMDETATENVAHWRGGTEVTLFSGRTQWQLRAGYFHEEQPLHFFALPREKTIEEGITAGVGIKVGRLAIDLAYQMISSSNRVVQLIDPRNIIDPSLLAVGTKDTTDHRLYVATVFQLSSDKTSKLLRYLFVGPPEEEDD